MQGSWVSRWVESYSFGAGVGWNLSAHIELVPWYYFYDFPNRPTNKYIFDPKEYFRIKHVLAKSRSRMRGKATFIGHWHVVKRTITPYQEINGFHKAYSSERYLYSPSPTTITHIYLNIAYIYTFKRFFHLITLNQSSKWVAEIIDSQDTDHCSDGNINLISPKQIWLGSSKQDGRLPVTATNSREMLFLCEMMDCMSSEWYCG